LPRAILLRAGKRHRDCKPADVLNLYQKIITNVNRRTKLKAARKVQTPPAGRNFLRR